MMNSASKSTKHARHPRQKQVPVSELKNGRSVVVQALGDDETDLLALEVRLVPDIKDSGRK